MDNISTTDSNMMISGWKSVNSPPVKAIILVQLQDQKFADQLKNMTK